MDLSDAGQHEMSPEEQEGMGGVVSATYLLRYTVAKSALSS